MVAFGRRGEPAPPVAVRSAPADMVAGATIEPEHACPISALAARLDSSQARLDRRIARLVAAVKAKTGRTVRLKPLLLIPETCWRGRHGKFLLHALELNPYDEWNVALLPAEPADAALVDAPQHPGEPSLQDIGVVNDMLAGLRRDYAEAMEQMEWTADRADIEQAHERALQSVKGYAADRLTALCGDPDAEADSEAKAESEAGSEAEAAPAAP